MNTKHIELKLMAAFFVAIVAWGTALAATYELTVDSGQTDLAAAMKAQYPDATLAAGDVIVKKGLGELTDSLDALEKGSSLDVRVQEGVFVINQPRKNSTWSVQKGAALRVAVSLSVLHDGSGGSLVKFNLAGSGTEACPGALYFASNSWAENQSVSYSLTDDAVVAFADSITGFNFSSQNYADTQNSVFYLNGHDLTFKKVGGAGSNTKYVRFRYAVSFIDPGRVILDGVWMTHMQNSEFFVKKTTSSGVEATTMPFELKNGARLSCGDAYLSKRIESLTCDADTSIGPVSGESSNTAEIREIIGCPTINAGQTITIGERLVARATDLAAGNRLVDEGTLVWKSGAACVIDIGNGTLVRRDTPYVVATAGAMSGVPVAGGFTEFPYRTFAIATSETQVEARYDEIPQGANDFAVFVPQGTTMTLADLIEGMTPEEKAALAGKRLTKLGEGTFAPDGDVASLNFSSLGILRGVYTATAKVQFPVHDGAIDVSVTNGATLRMGVSLESLASLGNFNLTVSGAGAAGSEGAVVFRTISSTAIQHASFFLTGDTVFAFPTSGEFNFSNSDQAPTDPNWNRFVMNRHKLTFKNAGAVGGSANYIRFRYQLNVVNPGLLVLDGVWLTRLASGGVNMTATDGGSNLLAVELTNGALLNCVNQTFAGKLSNVTCDFGTTIGKVKDAPSAITLAKITGCPTITSDQTVTVNALALRKEDFMAEHCLVATGILRFGSDCCVSVDALKGVEWTKTGFCVASATGGMDGAPIRSVVADDGVRARVAKRPAGQLEQQLRLLSVEGLVVTVR